MDERALALALFPGHALSVSICHDHIPFLQGSLWPDELALIDQAALRRRREFTAGRTAARTALIKLGVPPLSIGKNDRGAPVWPVGIVGSISHGAGVAVSVVAKAPAITGLGIDVEQSTEFPDEVGSLILHPSDLVGSGNSIRQYPQWQAIIFSAKEAFYKLYSCHFSEFLDFRSVALDFDGFKVSNRGSFRVRPSGSCFAGHEVCSRVQGAWILLEGRVYTATVSTHPDQEAHLAVRPARTDNSCASR